MSAPDVYEELVRLGNAAGKRSGEGYQMAEYAYDNAAEMVEFLRWRSAREEWPAEGCRCIIAARNLDDDVWLEYAYRIPRNGTSRWRYALGACECAKEG